MKGLLPVCYACAGMKWGETAILDGLTFHAGWTATGTVCYILEKCVAFLWLLTMNGSQASKMSLSYHCLSRLFIYSCVVYRKLQYINKKFPKSTMTFSFLFYHEGNTMVFLEIPWSIISIQLFMHIVNVQNYRSLKS